MEAIQGEDLRGVVRVTILTGGAEIFRRGGKVYNDRDGRWWNGRDVVEWKERIELQFCVIKKVYGTEIIFKSGRDKDKF